MSATLDLTSLTDVISNSQDFSPLQPGEDPFPLDEHNQLICDGTSFLDTWEVKWTINSLKAGGLVCRHCHRNKGRFPNLFSRALISDDIVSFWKSGGF